MKLMVPSAYGKEETEKFALANADVQALIGGKPVRKIIAVPGRIVNIVV
jgi:leucyl-tRNA synthetase